MSQIKEAPTVNLDQAQAIKLSLLVDLEAGWENLRKSPTSEADRTDTRQDLQGRQKAYEVFRAKLAAYNQAYTPGHVPEVLLNTPVRLGIWSRRSATSTSSWSTIRAVTARSTSWKKLIGGPTGSRPHERGPYRPVAGASQHRRRDSRAGSGSPVVRAAGQARAPGMNGHVRGSAAGVTCP